MKKIFKYHLWSEAESNNQNTTVNTGVGDSSAAIPSAPSQEPPVDSPIPGGDDGSQPEIPDNDDPTQQQAEPELNPELPEDNDSDFITWKNEFYKLAVGGDVQKMMDSIGEIRDNEGYKASEKKFIEDNYRILLLRQDANFDKLSKEIRRNLKQSINTENPGTSLIQVINTYGEPNPIFNEILLKLPGFYGEKAEIHRKFIAALTGSVQVGGGASKPDLLFNEKEYSINISTRIASKFGEINLGKWVLQEDDPSSFLSDPEMERLQEGSPEERRALTHRIVFESIASKFEKRAFIIHVIDEKGDIHSIGCDLGDCMKSAYKEGVLFVKTDNSKDAEIMIDSKGEIVPITNMSIFTRINTGELNDEGKSQKQKVPFIENRDGMLYLVADDKTLENVSQKTSGIYYKKTPYMGSYIELNNIQRCIPSPVEQIMRRC